MKLLHCADVHLGYETHGRLDPATGLNSRLLDFRRSFDAVAARAVEESVDLFLFAGDAYRTADPTPTQQKQFAEALRPVAEAGIPIVMVVGNHDHPVSFGKASSVDIFEVLGGNVEVFAVPTFRAEGQPAGPVQTRSGPLQLVALPWPIRSKILARDEYRGKTPHEVRQFVEEHYAAFVARVRGRGGPGRAARRRGPPHGPGVGAERERAGQPDRPRAHVHGRPTGAAGRRLRRAGAHPPVPGPEPRGVRAGRGAARGLLVVDRADLVQGARRRQRVRPRGHRRRGRAGPADALRVRPRRPRAGSSRSRPTRARPRTRRRPC